MATFQLPANCTHLDWCVKEYGQLNYIPNLAGNALFLALFCCGLIAQIALGVRYRTWGYLIAMLFGTALETIGYIARIELHQDIFNKGFFIMYLVCLTIGPAFFSAAIYLCLSRIVAVYGTGLSLVKPRTITLAFILCDVLSLVLQAVGGALASEATTHPALMTGVNIMIAGLSTQVASTAAFSLISLHLVWAVRRHPEKVDPNTTGFRKRTSFRLFLFAIAIATVGILIRCCFRVAELKDGFGSSLANNQVLFMVLDGVMMIITVLVLTASHPGLVLGEKWKIGAFYWRSKTHGPTKLELTSSSFPHSRDGLNKP